MHMDRIVLLLRRLGPGTVATRRYLTQ